MIDQKQPRQHELNEAAKRLSLESDWLRENGSRFAGQWVALVGSELIGSGVDGKAVYRQARTRTAETPTLLFVEPANESSFGGW